MRNRRTSDAAWSETAARRLAQLTADLGAAHLPGSAPAHDPDPGQTRDQPPAPSPAQSAAQSPAQGAGRPDDPGGPADEWWADHTRVSLPVATAPAGPAAIAAPTATAPVTAAPATAAPVVVPRPGRHASRRPRSLVPTWQPPRLGAAHVAVVALLVAVGLAVAAWWVVQQRPESLAPAPVAGASPLVADLPSASGSGEAADPAMEPAGEVTVDVTGKVRRPGIVVLAAGARVVDALEAAGGARPGVDLSSLNLARLLVDGEQVVVGLPAPTAAVPPPSPGTTGGAPATLVNLNLATEAELDTLPEVGPVTAAAIVAWREENGGFTSVDELLEVDGIGEVTLERISPYVTV